MSKRVLAWIGVILFGVAIGIFFGWKAGVGITCLLLAWGAILVATEETG